MGTVRLRQRQIRRTKGVTSWFVRRHDRREQVGEPSRFPRIDNAGEHGRSAPATGRQRLRRADEIPDRGQRTLDHRWSKRIEQSDDRSRVDSAQRRRSAGEVSAPEAPQPGLFELAPGLSGKIRDGVDWLIEGPHRASERRGLHKTFLAHDQPEVVDFDSPWRWAWPRYGTRSSTGSPRPDR